MKAIRWQAVRALSAVGLGVVLNSGCATVRERETPRGGAGAAGAPPAVAVPPPADATVSADSLNVVVVCGGNDEDGRAMAERLKGSIESALAGGGFRLDASRPDVKVGVSATAELFDRSGSYYLFNGSADAVTTRSQDGRLIGKHRFEAKGKRTLDREPALRALSDDLARQVVPWAVETSRPQKAGLRAEELTVCFPVLSTAGGRAEYAVLFAARVLKEPGVFSCVLKEEDRARRTQQFRVVYDEKRFPAGILNHLVGIAELNLRPAKR
jgi:hypothetical protein